MLKDLLRAARPAALLLVVVFPLAGCGAADPTGTTDGPVHLAPRAVPALQGGGNAPAPSDRDGHFDTSRPTVGRLDPDLLDALEHAARDAEADGVRLEITSGWRSRAHQQRLFDDAVRAYGSEAAARRYVATPDTSAHVTGDAVDVGPRAADEWLRRHGDRYGLCQIFANEIWHFELATTPGGRCPELLPDGSARR
jgi:hypothetical protein